MSRIVDWFKKRQNKTYDYYISFYYVVGDKTYPMSGYESFYLDNQSDRIDNLLALDRMAGEVQETLARQFKVGREDVHIVILSCKEFEH